MRWEPASNKTSFWDMLPNFRLPNCPHGPFAYQNSVQWVSYVDPLVCHPVCLKSARNVL